MKKPKFRQLQIFAAISRHSSFTRASEELFLTQSSVSSQMKQLTDQIGFPLIEQIGKKITITDVGRKVLALYAEYENSWFKFTEEMSDLADTDKGTISVSCVNTCQYFFPRVLGSFYQQYPEINISFKVYNRQQIMKRITDNIDDLYIMDYISEELDIKAVPFIDNPLVLISRPDHKFANQKNIPLVSLADEMFVVREPGSGTRREVDLFFDVEDITIKSKIELGSNEAMKQGIMGGLGIGVISLYAAALELKLGLLTNLDVEKFPLIRKWNIAYPNGKVIRPVVRTFLDFLKSEGRTISIDVLDNAEIIQPKNNESISKPIKNPAPA